MIPDGKHVVLREPRRATGMDLMIATIGDTASKRPFVNTRFNEYMPAISRDLLQRVDNSQQETVVLNFAKEVRAKMAAAKR